MYSKTELNLTSLEHDAGVVYGIDDIKDENIVYFYIPIVSITEFISDLIRTYINTSLMAKYQKEVDPLAIDAREEIIKSCIPAEYQQ